MTQPKLSERILRLEDAILEIKAILDQNAVITQLHNKLSVSVTHGHQDVQVQASSPAPAPVALPSPPSPDTVPQEVVVHEATVSPESPAVPSVPAPAQVVSDEQQNPTPIEFHPPVLPSKPSLVMVLSSLSPSSTVNEQKLVKRYKKYIDDFLEENPWEDEVHMDYRILALTMEFVSAAEKELRFLTNSKETTRGMSVAAVIWLMHTYHEYNNKAPLEFPPNLTLLIHTVYDMLTSTHYVIKPPEHVAQAPHKKSKWALNWSTFKNRWSQKKDAIAK